jgi:hypothetical protein
MVSSLRSDTDDTLPSEESLPGARRAQFKAYRADAADGSPSTPGSTAVHGDRPPEEHNSLLGITQLLERLTTQVDNSRIAQTESSADWERRFATFVQDTQDPQHVTERSRPKSQSRTGGNYVQQAIQEEALCSDDFRTNSSSSDTPIGHQTTNDHHHGSTPIFSNATPFSTSRTTRRQSILTALSPGPSRMTGGSSPYPDDDPPPPGNFRGYAPPTRAAFTGPSLHLKPDCPNVCWQLSHDKGPYGGNHDRFMKFVYKLPSDATTELMLLLNFLRTQFQATGFHHGLVPDIGEIHTLVDLTKSPIDATYMSNRDRPEWSNRSYWANAHRELGFSLHRVLAVVSRDSAVQALIFARVVSDSLMVGTVLLS